MRNVVHEVPFAQVDCYFAVGGALFEYPVEKGADTKIFIS